MPREFGGGDAPRLHGVLGLVGRLLVGPQVLVEHRFDVGLDFARVFGLDVLASERVWTMSPAMVPTLPL